jgi:peptide/nickel transport system substrate-binding protein
MAAIVSACGGAGADANTVATLQAQLSAMPPSDANNADAAATVSALETQVADAQNAAGAENFEDLSGVPMGPADTYVFYDIGDPETLDPAVHYDTASSDAIRLVYDTLIFFKGSSVSEFAPMLATDWSVSDDGKTYTFTIRKDVKFHAGGDLEPHDVAYTFHRFLLSGWDAYNGGPGGLLMEPMLGYIGIGAEGDGGLFDASGGDDTKVCETVKSSVVADDAAGTVTINLAEARAYYPQLVAQTWSSILDSEWMAENGDWDGDCGTWRDFYFKEASQTSLYNKENGTGPYILDKWEVGNEQVFVANEDYWLKEPLWEGSTIDGVPELKTVTIKNVTEWSTRLAALKAGDADGIVVDPAYFDQIDPMVKDVVEGTDVAADPTTERNPKGNLREYHGIPQLSSTDMFLNQGINVEGDNPLVGSGALDGAGIPPDFFSDIHVRKAFNYCFDRDTYIEEVLHGEAIPRRGPINSGLLGYDESVEPYPFDLDKCAEELKLAWDGKVAEVGFTMTLAYNAGNDSRRIADELLRDGLVSANAKMAEGDINKQNISVGVVAMAWPSYLAARRAGRLPINTTGWLEDFHHPHNWVTPYMSCNGDFSGQQALPEETCGPWDELIGKAVAEQDEAKAGAIYAQLQKEAMDYALDIFVDQGTARRYEPLWVKGWYYQPLFSRAYFPALSKSAD